MEENCYIHGKGCEEDSYSISKWRNQFGNNYPKYHYFYDDMTISSLSGISRSSSI